MAQAAIIAVKAAAAWLAKKGVAQAIVKLGFQLAASAVVSKLAAPGRPKNQGSLIPTSLRSDAPRRLQIGKRIQGGVFGDWMTKGNINEDTWRVFYLGEGPMGAITKIFADGNQVWSGTLTHGQTATLTSLREGTPVTVKYYDGRPGQTADSALVAENVGWTSNHVGTGCAYVIVYGRFHDTQFVVPPDFTFEMEGAKIYDRRLDSTAGGSGTQRLKDPNTWSISTNPAVALDHYLQGRFLSSSDTEPVFGVGLDPSLIPYDRFEAMADECDELVALKASGTQKRYEMNGFIEADERFRDVIVGVCDAMNARPADFGGLISVISGASKVPVLTLDLDDGIDEAAEQYTPKVSFGALVSGVEGRYQDPANNYAPADYPRVTDQTWIDEDGGEARYVTRELAHEISQERAERLATLFAQRSRRQATLSGVYPLKALKLEEGDWFTRTGGIFGPSGKVFEVVGSPILDAQTMTVAVQGIEVDPTDSAWDETEAADLADTPDPDWNRSTVYIPLLTVTAYSEASGGTTLPAVRFTNLSYTNDPAPQVSVEIARNDGNGGPLGDRYSLIMPPGQQYGALSGLLAGAGYVARWKGRIGEGESEWSGWTAFTATGTYAVGTASQVNWSGVLDDGGRPDNNADVTALGIAAGIAGQGDLATLSTVTPANVSVPLAGDYLPQVYRLFQYDNHPPLTLVNFAKGATGVLNPYTRGNAFKVNATGGSTQEIRLTDSGAYNVFLPGGQTYLVRAEALLQTTTLHPNRKWRVFLENDSGVRFFSDIRTSPGAHTFEFDLTGQPDAMYFLVFRQYDLTAGQETSESGFWPVSANIVLKAHSGMTVPAPNYADWQDTLKLAGVEDGANVTGDHIALGINSQGDLATRNDVTWGTDFASYPGDNSLLNINQLWSEVSGSGRPDDNADVTALGISAGFTGQGPLATSTFTESDVSNDAVAIGSNSIQDTRFDFPNSRHWLKDSGTLTQGFMTDGLEVGVLTSTGNSRIRLPYYTPPQKHYGLSVSDGDRVGASALVGLDGAVSNEYVQLRIEWRNEFGSFVGSTSVNSTSPGNGNGGRGTLTYLSIYGDAPVGAKWALFAVTSHDGSGTNPTLTLKCAEPLLCRMLPDQTSVPPFSHGSGGDRASDETGINTAAAISGQDWGATASQADAENAQLVPSINTAALTANWPQVTGTGRPDDNADVTGDNVASAIDNQGGLATQDNVAWGSDLTGRPTELTDGRILAGLDSSGDLNRDLSTARANSSNLLRRTLGGLFTGELAANVTGNHTAAAIAGQGALATRSDVTWGTDFTSYPGDTALLNSNQSWSDVSGAGLPDDNADVTASNVASAVAGQGALATSALSETEVDSDYYQVRISTRGSLTGNHHFLESTQGIRWMRDGTLLTALGRSYTVSVWDIASRSWDSHTTYDVFGNSSNAATMAAALMALPYLEKIVFVVSYDEPQRFRLTNGLDTAMYHIGASRAIFGSSDDYFKFRSAYILIGSPGIGEGMGQEYYKGTADSSAVSFLEITYDLLSGSLQGGGGTPIVDAGANVTGDHTAAAIVGQGSLATLNSAAWGSNISGRPTELTDGRILAGLDSSGDLNRNISTTRANNSNILRRSAGGLFTGDLDADLTSSSTAAAIAGQSSWATYGGLNPLNVAGQVQRLNTSGELPGGYVVNGGYSIAQLWPAEAGANATEGRTAAAIAGQSSWATYSGLVPSAVAAQVSNLNSSGHLEAGDVYLNGVDFLNNRWPDEGGANVTGNHVSSGFAGQGALATRNDVDTAQIVSTAVSVRGSDNQSGAITVPSDTWTVVNTVTGFQSVGLSTQVTVSFILQAWSLSGATNVMKYRVKRNGSIIHGPYSIPVSTDVTAIDEFINRYGSLGVAQDIFLDAPPSGAHTYTVEAFQTIPGTPSNNQAENRYIGIDQRKL